MHSLTKPEILRTYLADPHVRAHQLDWGAGAVAEATWHLPGDVTLRGPAPEHFGIDILRTDVNAFDLHVVWNRLTLSWTGLTRVQIMTSCLAHLLSALGGDLWRQLEQPLPAAAA